MDFGPGICTDQCNSDFRSSFFLSLFYAHCFSPTSGILRKLKFYFSSYFGITRKSNFFFKSNILRGSNSLGNFYPIKTWIGTNTVSQCLCTNLCIFWIVLVYFGIFWYIWVYLGIFGYIWVYLGIFGYIWVYPWQMTTLS